MRSSTNYLLSKDDVGRSKVATRTLPPGGHIFGYKEKPDACGVRGRKFINPTKFYQFNNFYP